MIPSDRRLQVATLVSLLVMGVGACDDTATSDDGPGSSGLTEPGSALRLGETATLPRNGAEVLEVTISSIEKGSSTDLDAVSSAVGKTPYFVRYELVHVSGSPPYLPLDTILSGRADGEQVQLLAPVDSVPSCVSETFGANAAVGTTVSGCATFVTAAGSAPLDRIVYSDGDDYDAFDGHQVSWE